MKFNKKITVTALSTVLGLGLVGSISGAVAWYQYSTRATTSIVGTSAGKSGSLQINKASGAKTDTNWVRDLITSDVKGSFDGKYQPVTFGNTTKNGALPQRNEGTTESPSYVPGAYKTPKAGVANMTDWDKAVNGTDYLQYSVYLQALEMKADAGAYDYRRVQKDVYLTDITLEATGYVAETASTHKITDAIRVHLDVEENDGSASTHTYFLISHNSLGESGIPTHGSLDLDGDGQADKLGGYEWAAGRDGEIDYGDITTEPSTKAGKQTSYSIADLKSTYTGSAFSGGQVIAHTPANDTGYTKITVTIWNEGWAQLDPYASPKDEDVDAMWDPTTRNNAEFHVGLTFDVGNF